MGTRRTVGLVAMLAAGSLTWACTPAVPPLELDPAPTVVSVTRPETDGPLRMVGQRLVDADGRTVLVHGMNIVVKGGPMIATPEIGLSDEQLDYLTGNGFDAVRLGVSYGSLAPAPGEVDEAYLDQVVTAVDRLSSHGLWVQIDFHQDVFAGMPAWATPPDALALDDRPPEFLSFIGWAASYLSPRSVRQWNSFLAGEPVAGGRSVAARLGEAAAAVAGRVADRDRVIGIELINEPFSGDATVRCILEGCPDRDTLLARRYAEMAAPIRAAAPEMPVWMEPFAPTGYAAAGSIPVAPGSIPTTSSGPQIGVAWHLYCYGTDRGGAALEPSDVERTLCTQRFQHGFDNGAMLSRDLDAPRILNEFGAADVAFDAATVTRTADDQLISWMYWHQSGQTDGLDSGIPDAVEAQIIRPYPQATAGTPRSLSFDPVTGAFRFRYAPDPAVAALDVAVPSRQYPSGYDVVVSGGSVTSAPQSGNLTVVASGTGDVDVRITRR